MKKLTLCVPCFGRPQRTLRAMQCVLNQDIDGWEAFFIGDGCPTFERMLSEGVFDNFQISAEQNGNEFHIFNLDQNYGGWGYAARNLCFQLADSEYTLFMDNDDMIKPYHFRNYYNTIKDTGDDFMFFNSYIEPIAQERNTELKFGSIGHSEIIVKTSWLKDYEQKGEYGQDWDLIDSLIRRGAISSKAYNKPATYIVKELGGGHENRQRLTEQGID